MAPPQVLLVEDSDFLTERIQETVRAHHDIHVDAVGTVQAAQVRLGDDTTSVDCVVTNYDLPDGTGLDLTRWIREASTTPTVPVVLLSGDPPDDVVGAAFDAGVSAFVSKTTDVFDTMELLANRIRLAIRAAE